MNKYSYLIIRFSVAMSMFGHGLVRMPKLKKFSDWMVGSFENSMLPEVLVLPFSYALPFLELLVGLFLMLGLFTKQASIAGGLIMISLVFGSAMIESWGSLPSQMIHAAFFAILIHYASSNSYAIDKQIKK